MGQPRKLVLRLQPIYPLKVFHRERLNPESYSHLQPIRAKKFGLPRAQNHPETYQGHPMLTNRYASI